jgi:signal transduction histidine kinase
MQQAHARCALVEEEVRVDNAITEAIRYSDASTPRGELVIEQEVQRLPPVVVDKHRLVQILVNLIENAKRAAGTGETDRPRVVLEAREEPRGRLRFVVKDNGVGIRHEDLSRVFRHGYTTTTDGHGFGLHASVLAARDLGGSLHCASDGLGRGATFTLDIPLRSAWPDVADPTEEQKTVKAQAPSMPV